MTLTQTTLANGLQILLKEIHTAPLVSYWVWYRVGSKDEPTGKTGISHWTEHMQFKGTSQFPSSVLDKAIARESGTWNAFTFEGHALQFRFGAASGPVVAGVIGREKFTYDLWGDTVNLTSRLETYGEANKIHISREMYEILKDEFTCKRCGLVTLKGKGKVETFWLLGKRSQR